MITNKEITENNNNFATKNELKSADESMALSLKSSIVDLVQSSAFSKSNSI